MCSAESCHLKCDGSNCEQTCNNEQGTCSLKCNRGNCTQTCIKGTCDLKCNGTHCRQTCNEDACSLEQGSCQVQRPVTGRESKCQQKCEDKKSQCTKNFITITKAPTWTGKRSNESAIALTGRALSRGREGLKKLLHRFLPFLLPFVHTFANSGAYLDKSGET